MAGGPMNPTHLYFVLTIMTLAAMVAIAGNILIIYLFLSMKKMARLTPHIFLTNLALCDLLLGLKLPIFFLVTLVKPNWWLVQNNAACMALGAVDSIAIRVVVAGMTAVAIDRYLAVLHALKYPKILSEQRAFLIVFTLWTYCLVWAALPIIIHLVNGELMYVFSPAHNLCTIKTLNPAGSHKVFIAADTLLNFIIPLSVMTFCYLKIARKVLSPSKMGNTIKKFMRSKSQSLRKRSSGIPSTNGYPPQKDSGVGIKVDNCDSLSSSSDGEEYIELPAVTKPQHTGRDPAILTPIATPVISPDHMYEDGGTSGGSPPPPADKSCHGNNKTISIAEMYKRTGLSVNSNVTLSRYSVDSVDKKSNSSRRCSWTEESAAAIKDSARKMSSAVTNSVMHQLKRISQASNAYSKMSKYQQKIARTTVVVYFSFVICFTPFIISQVLVLSNSKGHLDQGEKTFVFASVCVVYFSACINVIIYGTMHRNIKATLRNLLHSHA